jgi:hypothetical protein
MVRGVSADEIFVKKKKGSNLKSYLKDILWIFLHVMH